MFALSRQHVKSNDKSMHGDDAAGPGAGGMPGRITSSVSICGRLIQVLHRTDCSPQTRLALHVPSS